MSNITLEGWECARSEQPRRPRAPKFVASGQLLKATAWLDGDFVWDNGALKLDSRGQIFAFDEAQIARTGRALDKLEARDFQRATIRKRRAKWNLLRELGALEAPDFDLLCAQSRRRNPAALERLATLLVLESLNVELPQSPTRALFLAWPHSQTALESLVADEDWPHESRELAAFIVGASKPANIAQLPKGARAVAALGARFGSELQSFDSPALLLRALHQDEALAGQILALKQTQSPFAPDVLALDKLVRAHGLQRGIAIGEQLANIGEVWPEIPGIAVYDDEPSAAILRRANVMWRRARRDWHAECREVLLAIALHNPSAIEPFLKVCRELLRFPETLLVRRKRGRKSLRRLPRNSVDGALFCAQINVFGGRKTLSLARRALNAPDAVDFLELWLETAICHFKSCHSQRYDAGDAKVSQKWFGALMREIENEFEPIARLSNLGGGAFARTIRAREHHQQLGRAASLDTRGACAECVQSWVQMVGELPMRSYSLRRWCRFWGKFDDRRARPIMSALVQATGALTLKARAAVWSGVLQTMPSRLGAREIWPHLPALLRQFVPMLADWDARAIFSACVSLRKVAAICHRFEIPVAQWPVLVGALIENRSAIEQSDYEECQQLCEIVARVCLACESTNITQLEADLRATLQHSLVLLSDYDALEKALPGASVAQSRPQLARALRCGLEIAPTRTLSALEHLAALENIHQLDALKTLESPAPELGLSWNSIADLSPELAAIARETAGWQTLANQAATPPMGAQKILDWPRKWEREIEALQSRSAGNPHLTARLDNLRARLADEPKWRAQQADEIGELLHNATKRAAFEALERTIENAFRARLQALCGALPAEFQFDDDWFNALLLGGDVEYNRKWAHALLRHEIAREENWRQNLPGNARFLENLRQRGVDIEFYLSAFGRSHGGLWLWIEDEPLSILQMGNRFNTCLSRGGCNAFSSIANAIELNKRVVYARDEKGHIVARQLWAISEDYRLIGFTIYSTYASDKRAGLEAHFANHARQWARSCGLELADDGEVANLVAPNWYDDGVRAWEIEKISRKKNAASMVKLSLKTKFSSRVA